MIKKCSNTKKKYNFLQEMYRKGYKFNNMRDYCEKFTDLMKTDANLQKALFKEEHEYVQIEYNDGLVNFYAHEIQLRVNGL